MHFGQNNEHGIRSRQVPVWRGLLSIVSSVINSGPNIYYDRIPDCTRSGMYKLHCIYGSNFQVDSDHKPLEIKIKKPIRMAPTTLQRILLRLQPFDVDICYKPGKEVLISDAFLDSRMNLKTSTLNSTCRLNLYSFHMRV